MKPATTAVLGWTEQFICGNGFGTLIDFLRPDALMLIATLPPVEGYRLLRLIFRMGLRFAILG